MKKILLVEDDKGMLGFNKALFTEQGYTVSTAMSLSEAQKQFAGNAPDIIVLDVMLPDGSGVDWLCEIRKTSRVPVMLLSAKGDLRDKLKGFSSGADDYLPKPYDYEELLARVNALLRRAEQMPERLKFRALTLDIGSGQAFLHNRDLLLRRKEFELILLLIQMKGKPVDGEYIYKKIWNQPSAGNLNALQTVISRLRKKIEPSGLDVYYERGSGYTLE